MKHRVTLSADDLALILNALDWLKADQLNSINYAEDDTDECVNEVNDNFDPLVKRLTRLVVKSIA